MGELREILAANIRHHRALTGRSQRWLAERCGISRTHLVNLEHARNAPSIEVLAVLADAFDLLPGDLLNEPDQRCPTCGQYVVTPDRVAPTGNPTEDDQ